MAEEGEGAKKPSASEVTAKALKAMGIKADKGPSMTGIEKKEDYSELAGTLVPEATLLSQNGELSKAVDMLLSLEKKCRLGNDVSTLKLTVTTICELCRGQGDWAKLNSALGTIAKRHQQSKYAVMAVVNLCMGWIDTTPDKATKVDLLVALREVTDGKIYVEAERARITRQLAEIKEADGDIAGACDVLLDVYVETYGALSKREKVDFILEQIRMTIAKQDWVRVLIVAKKVQKKIIDEPDLQDLKMRYHRLMTEYYLHEKDAFELAQSFYSLYDTPCIAEDDSDLVSGWKHHLKSCILFLCLAPQTNHQADMLHRIAAIEKLEQLDEWHGVVKLFTTDEIITFPLPQQPVVEQLLKEVGTPELFPYWQQQTHERTTQHNMRVVAKYYKRIRMVRLAELLGLTVDEAEKQLSALVSQGALYAKIDRPAGIASFKSRATAEETLSEWSSDIGQLLSLVERTCHLINKENMLHKV
uniref:PCI domain-containing protein n=1 Tax=Rhizochromulina marina TaxID=1034831 RepID=A0A7S2RAT1_9STRA